MPVKPKTAARPFKAPRTAPPRFAAKGSPARKLIPLAPGDLADYLKKAPAPEAAWVRAAGFKAKRGELLLLPGAKGVEAALLGLGTEESARRARFGLVPPLGKLPPGAWKLTGNLPRAARREFALGWLLASYRYALTEGAENAPPAALLLCPEGLDAEALLAEAEGEFLTRDLVNAPANLMGPEELEVAFLTLARRFGAKTSVVRGEDLLKKNFPLVHAVGRASPRAPRILSMEWGRKGPRLTLVGKGVCFDTGGLDLKPSASMLQMKKDMGGAATVLGLALMIMQRKLPLRLRVIVPAVENAVSGSAMRPRDIVQSRKGLTVEINNTDAEGRLILADALAWAAEGKPDLLISMATLTGAARVAVGPDLAPFFAEGEKDSAALMAAASGAADPLWPLPFWAPYEPMIEPGIADLDNAPAGGFAGAITAALFLRRFAAHPRYIHFDIFAHQPQDAPGRPKGGTGQGARAILHALPALLGI